MFKKNQRVVSRTEPDLGLGIIKSATKQGNIKVNFPRVNEDRAYSNLVESPIQRYKLRVGDKATPSASSNFIVAEVIQEDGLLKYKSNDQECWEWELSDQVENVSVLDMFLSGQLSHYKTFDLRKEAWRIRGEARASGAMGFVGARVTPLAHQLYIAKTVLSQSEPRVLLSDEVGLGKTIEAGLIFSAMRAIGRAERVLILVPESLTHQWLAEMFRRFNELLTVLDYDRCEEEEASQGQSAFNVINKSICSLEFLLDNPKYMNQALSVDWDLIIVDEAHHLKLPEHENEITDWSLVKGLSLKTRGLLLLTATPRMYGLKSQFSLLNIVDPDRFNDFTLFSNQAQEIKELASIALDISNNAVNDSHRLKLKELFPEDNSLHELLNDKSTHKEKLLNSLVDRHGTGRVFYRNRREKLQGFPKRVLRSEGIDGGTKSKLEWLHNFCMNLGSEKALVICSSKDTVLRINNWFKKNSDKRISIFHEDLSILERDIYAAKFAQEESINMLVCSEIGGEGRNFQFCHNLILFDLPSHPDLVEQRIGRLDRIGQSKDIQIHALWNKASHEEVLFNWYHNGLNCFENSWSGAGIIFEKFKDEIEVLMDSFDSKLKESSIQLMGLIENTKKESAKLQKTQSESVDILVDINSFNKKMGEELVELVDDKDDNPRLELFMRGLFDHYGIQYKDFDDRGSLLIDGESLSFIENFPGISSEEDTVMTFDRSVALEREDITFVTQDHQIAEESLSMLIDRNEGVASLCKWTDCPYESGALVEVSVVLQASGPKYLELDRYLPLQIKSFVINHHGKYIANSPHLEDQDLVRELSSAEEPEIGERMQKFLHPIIERVNNDCNKWFEPQLNNAIKIAHERLSIEKARLEYLASVNKNMNNNEIDYINEKILKVAEHLKSSKPRIDGIRIIFTEERNY